jgi:hypothetical protein
MPIIDPNHKENKFFSPVPKSPNHAGLLYVKKNRPRLGHAWAPLRRSEVIGLLLYCRVSVKQIRIFGV